MQYAFKRPILFSLMSLLCCLCAMAAGETKEVQDKTFTIVLDAGHGGHDAGAVGSFPKKRHQSEGDVGGRATVGGQLSGHKVIYTRKTDVFIPLDRRANIANRNKADLFVSIHTNSLPKGRIAYGSETYTLGMARAAANLEVAKRENSVITYEKTTSRPMRVSTPIRLRAISSSS